MPKGTDLALHDASALADIADTLNRRSRMTLGYLTPSENSPSSLGTPIETAKS
jgi:IS30 family transposase